MSTYQLESPDFDRLVSLSEKAVRDENLAANQAFAAAMNREIGKGKITAKAGTFVDRSPHFGARRLYGDPIGSPCGSPAALCTEAGGAHSGAQTLR